MKMLLPLFISMISHCVHAQWSADFSLGWQDQGWVGDTNYFAVNTNEQLQSDFPQSGFYQLTHPLSQPSENFEFSCFIRQNFAGSSNNFGRILLYESGVPDSVGHNNNAGVKGWVIQWGNTGSTDKIQIFWNNGNTWEPLTESFSIANGVYGNFKMQCDTTVCFLFQDNDSSEYFPLFSAIIPENFNVNFLSIQAQCTASNVNNFYWDDFYFGPHQSPLIPSNPEKRSVVFNEILADPEPPRSNARCEFIELYNTTNDSIQLLNWTLYNTTTAHILPSENIPPHGFLVICKIEDTIYFPGIPCSGLDSFSALTNTGDSLTLCSENGTVIDVFQYDLHTYKNDDKTDGGWSIEQINPRMKCSGRFNWKACKIEAGATPGLVNSTFDTLFRTPPPQIIDWGVDLHQKLFLWTNLSWNQDSIRVWWNNQSAILSCTSFNDSLIIDLPGYTGEIPFEIDSVRFCESNLPIDFKIEIPEIHPFDQQQIIFNEILFDPKEDQEPFVELYNNSNQTVSLDFFWLKNQSGSIYSFQNHHHFIAPFQQLAITEGALRTVCSPSHIHIAPSLPYFTVENGSVFLGYSFFPLDTLVYDVSMHHPNLSDTEGFSLERVEGNLQSEKWISASSLENGQTPGCPNSQQWNNVYNELDFQIIPPYFSPNNDGEKDIIAFVYHGNEAGVELKLQIFTENGLPIKTLSAADWSGNRAQWTWDGISEWSSICSPGVYFVVIDVKNGQRIQSLKTMKSFVLSP